MSRETTSAEVMYAALTTASFAPSFDPAFQDPEFYEADAEVLAVRCDGYKAMLVPVGSARAIHDDGREIASWQEYRDAFPDGCLNLDEWAVLTNPWFEMWITNNGEFLFPGGWSDPIFSVDEGITAIRAFLLEEVLHAA